MASWQPSSSSAALCPCLGPNVTPRYRDALHTTCKLRSLPTDGKLAMQALFHIAEVRDLQVGTRGTRRPRPRSRDNGRAGDERRGDDEHHQTTASFRGFLQGERGAVHRIETGENSLLQVIPVPEIANNTLSGRCKLYLSTGLQVRCTTSQRPAMGLLNYILHLFQAQVMHAGFCTVTHQDVTNSGFGVLAWLRQVKLLQSPPLCAPVPDCFPPASSSHDHRWPACRYSSCGLTPTVNGKV